MSVQCTNRCAGLLLLFPSRTRRTFTHSGSSHFASAIARNGDESTAAAKNLLLVIRLDFTFFNNTLSFDVGHPARREHSNKRAAGMPKCIAATPFPGQTSFTTPQ